MSNKISIGFTGDLGFSGYFTGAYKKTDLLDSNLKEFFKTNDATVINYENPITACRITKKKRLAHRSDPEALDFIKANFNNPILSFANNHLMDYGYIGMIDTIENTESARLPYIGAGRNIDEASKMIIVGDDIKIGIMSMQYKKYMVANDIHGGPFHESSDAYIKKRVEEFRSSVDWLVLVYHGGDEFLYSPMPYIRKLLKKYLDWGCDVVVAHHPHVVQGFEHVGKKAIFYSLGNFIFDTDYQRVQEGTDKGMLLRLTFTKNDFSFDGVPTFIDRDKQTVSQGTPNSHFADISKTNYNALWTSEAYRKLKVMQKAAELKELESEEKMQLAEKESLRVEQLKRAHIMKLIQKNLADDSDLDEFDENVENEKQTATGKKSFYKKMRAAYRKIVVQAPANRRALKLKCGRLLYKIFYKSKTISD